MTEKQFVISQSLVTAILAYLQKRPYEEVAQAIPALLHLQEFKPEEIDEVPDAS